MGPLKSSSPMSIDWKAIEFFFASSLFSRSRTAPAIAAAKGLLSERGSSGRKPPLPPTAGVRGGCSGVVGSISMLLPWLLLPLLLVDGSFTMMVGIGIEEHVLSTGVVGMETGPDGLVGM